MILLLTFIIGMVVIAGLTFLLGFRLGGDRWRSELHTVHLEAAQAKRQLHDLTRQAFVAMTEEAQRRKPHSGGGRIDKGR